ncbi:MAG: hypothetical protein KDK06_13595, partial [Gammaproteobacteria bacterium]|nr:hypothetical protein [Gammaproteobacteria bacterium]
EPRGRRVGVTTARILVQAARGRPLSRARRIDRTRAWIAGAGCNASIGGRVISRRTVRRRRPALARGMAE